MIPSQAPHCPYCSRPMQELTKSIVDSKLIAISYGCSCKGILYRENYHAGQRERTS